MLIINIDNERKVEKEENEKTQKKAQATEKMISIHTFM
jgi:hypothetical protein